MEQNSIQESYTVSEATIKTMKANKSKGTSPELILRKTLRDLGFPGYRLNWKGAPGKPDIAYPGRKIAIFVNGCFWHRCPVCNRTIPKSNTDYWKRKFAANIERDNRTNEALRQKGWIVITIWECQIKKNMNEVKQILSMALSEKEQK